ncbi:hypothetical protein MAPG_10412 [Magnaporthiopsis poae ATCC 64411]|uniref:Response regulatory domain-containing protein n=1 Tax=Magnaporthiopsis poae (strain ATCC 64411 / 73-15) TaxID=644358 RepID=A0A0C4ECI5_MAGP6|nr:hypothetical protein MAPG_10412 [Magnaporthiopsis poae ATCC 64411]
MGELASRIRAKFKRRASASPSIESPTDSNRHSPPAGRPRSLAGIQRPASFAERLPSSRSNHTDKWYATNEHVLSPLIPDQEPSAAPQPLQQPPLLSTVTPAPIPASTPEPKKELVPTTRDAKEEARPAARGQSCPGVQPEEAADTSTRDPRPEPELQPEPEPAQPQPAKAQQEPEPQSEPEPKLPATMSASRSPAGLAAATADTAPVPDVQELCRDYINVNGNSYSVPAGKKPGEQNKYNQQSLPASADVFAPATSAPTDSAEQRQRQSSDSGSDRADLRAKDKSGKDQQPVLPSINEHPQDLATDTTDSTAITTDDDDLPQCSYPASPGSDSGAPTPKAPTVAFSSPSTSPDPDTTHALRTIAETQANQMNSSTSSVPARHSLVLPLASSATEVPGAARRPSSTSHSNANLQQNSPTAPPPTAAEMQAMQQLLQAMLGGGARAEEPVGVNGDQLPAVPSKNKNRVWVRRPSASATLIHIGETDVVDDVRDLILRKYANSLGRQFDSPDLTLRIIPREHQRERALGPDEHMMRTLEAYFPGGQTVEEALLIDVPLRRTPRPSPRAGGVPHMQMMNAAVYYGPPSEDRRPPENGTDYFGPAVVNGISLSNGIVAHPHSISVINTGQIPQVPSPGGTRTRAYRDRPDRPRLGRQHTSSPTVLNLLGAHHQQMGGNANVEQAAASPPTAPPMPTPPASDGTMQVVATPPAGGPARVASPRPNAARPKKSKKSTDHPRLPLGVFSGGVPPINVLIVEDNPINLRLLEVFVKRLKVRWDTAVNGREALDKWRQGGFHLVLMDIQLPVMSGLDATREIRRLERVNSVNVIPSRRASVVKTPPKEEDRLINHMTKFKSPVIIVALTASSLQSDRHEALAAGCNDFLTKPVNFVWFEKKIMEWGCMQALIDYDGWKKWKEEYARLHQQDNETKKSSSSKTKSKKNRSSSASTVSAGPSNSAAQ